MKTIIIKQPNTAKRKWKIEFINPAGVEIMSTATGCGGVILRTDKEGLIQMYLALDEIIRKRV